jgi:hypothetical protein
MNDNQDNRKNAGQRKERWLPVVDWQWENICQFVQSSVHQCVPRNNRNFETVCTIL